MIDPAPDNAISVAFNEARAVMSEFRNADPAPNGWAATDGVWNAFARTIGDLKTDAYGARAGGRIGEAVQLEARAMAQLEAAKLRWQGKANAATAERDRKAAELRGRHAAHVRFPIVPQAQPLFDACRALTRQIDKLRDGANFGRYDDTKLLAETMPELDAAADAFKKAVGAARREARLRVSAAAAAAAISDLKAA